jgi:hypothetical protein
VLKESLGWLVPGGELVGELTDGESGVSLVVERFGWIEGEISEADPVEAQVDRIETPVRLGGATASTLDFALPYVFDGVFGTERPANATWQVTLTRQGELPADKAEEGPPAAAEPAAPATTVDPTSPTAWEEAVISTFPRWNQAMALAIGDRDTIATCRSEGLDRLRDSALEAGFEQVVQDAFENALPADAAITDWSFGELPDTFVTNSGIEIPDAVPCHLRFSNPEITPDEDCGAGILGPLLDDEDRCADFETLFRCEVIDLETPVGEQGPHIDWSVQASEEGCGYSVDYTAEDAVEVRKVCRLPKVPHDCAEIALCHDHGSETADPVSSVLVEELPDALPPLSGDLLCQAGPRGAVVEVDRRLETSDGTLRLTSQQMFEACAADLERLQTEVTGNTLQELFQSQGCIDVVRRLFAMGAVAEVVHDPGPSKLRARAVMHRVAQQWLHTLAFFARQSITRETLGPVIQMSSGAAAEDWVGAEEVIDLVLSGLAPLVHPRIGGALEALPDPLVASPDYRGYVTGATPDSPSPDHDQPTGLAVGLLESLQALTDLVAVRLQAARYTADQSALEQAARAFRYSLILRALAEAHHARALVEAEGELSWSFRFETARTALDAATAAALNAALALQAGRNPLGVEETDLPLYFKEEAEVSASEGFSAISDFLIGDGTVQTPAWAPRYVAEAEEALDAARTAWLAQQDRELQNILVSGDLTERVVALKTAYGEALTELCGHPTGVTAVQMLDWSDFDPDTCFRVTGDEDRDCGLTADELAAQEQGVLAQFGQEDIRYLFCMALELADRSTSPAGFVDRKLQDWAEECKSLGDGQGYVEPVDCATDEAAGESCELCVGCFVDVEEEHETTCCYGETCGPCTEIVVVTEDLGQLALNSEDVSEELLAEVRQKCGPAPELPQLDVDEEWNNRSECYRGRLGELALTLQAIAKDVEIARSELADHQDAYDVVMKSCIIQQLGGKRKEDALAAHNDTMEGLQKKKRNADIAAAACEAVKDCAELTSDATNITKLGFGSVSAVVGCAAAAGEAVAKGFSAEAEFDMAVEEGEHEELMLSIENDIADKTCFNDAELQLVGIRTAGLNIQRAMIDLELGLLQFQEAKQDARAKYAEGRAAAQALKDRTVWPKQYDYWVDQAVETFRRKMTLARRLTYLAVLAVEYEYQMSLTGTDAVALRQRVLASALPSELDAVLDELIQAGGTRTIGGSRPNDLKAVISLRDHLLQLADHSTLPETELTLTPEQRFRLLLSAPEYRVFDADGSYLGQRIPFNIAPLDAIGLGQWQGIPLLAENDCAERLWSVNAAIIGGKESTEAPHAGRGEIYRGSPQTFVRIDLLKMNTFYSQWCGEPDPGLDPFQTATVRPSRNLFRGAEERDSTPTGEEARYTRARIEAYFNKSREDFESDEYANGDTLELAGRGLYGSYALFIPAGVISLFQDGAYTDGLNLAEVDDILLRLDYLSVAH